MTRIPRQKLLAFSAAFLERRGAPAEIAQTVSRAIVDTEAFGIKTHGLAFLPYADQNIPSVVDPAALPELLSQKGSTALVDAHRGFSQLSVRMAEDLALAKARANGIAMITVRNASWLGALGVYLISIARAGFLAQLWAQTNSCRDAAPVDGLDGRFSTNPVALAFPTPGDPMVADFSTTVVSMGKARQMVRLGLKAPEKMFRDSAGNLTDDPGVVAREGTILFLGGEHGGHKGYAMSLWNEALAAISGGGCNSPSAPTVQNFSLIVIDPDAFIDAPAYGAEMGRFLAHMKGSRLLPGRSAIRLPGERGFAAMRDAEANGVPVEDHMREKLDAIAKKYCLDPLA